MSRVAISEWLLLGAMLARACEPGADRGSRGPRVGHHHHAFTPRTALRQAVSTASTKRMCCRISCIATNRKPRASKPERILGKLPNIPGRPDVTMRLETPVIYFHPPPNKAFTAPIDITVRFRGGVINEFYPDAAASVALDRERIANKVRGRRHHTEWNGDVLNNYVVGTLRLERAAPARHRGRAAHEERNLARAARSELGERVQSGSRRRRAVPFLSRRRASRCAVGDENHARFG